MAGSFAPQLAELLEVVEGEAVAGQVEHGVLQGAGVAVGQDESVAVVPAGVGGGVVHDLRPEQVGHRGAAHGGAGMAGVGGLRHVGAEGADGVDALELEGGASVRRRRRR